MVVNDQPGFVVNRILVPYLMEAVKMHNEGFSAREIDRAMLDFGMPMGPIRLLDEIGLDVANHVAKTLSSAFPERVPLDDSLDRMVQHGCLGRKNGRGFYRYERGQPTEEEASARRLPRPADGANTGSIQHRLVTLISNEAQRCLDDGVATCGDDIDLAMVLGTGYPPFRGGPLAYARENLRPAS